MREPIIKGTSDAAPGPREPERKPDLFDEKLRPQRLHEVIGQRRVAERLSIALEAAQAR